MKTLKTKRRYFTIKRKLISYLQVESLNENFYEKHRNLFILFIYHIALQTVMYLTLHL